jgi:hypothetical protein
MVGIAETARERESRAEERRGALGLVINKGGRFVAAAVRWCWWSSCWNHEAPATTTTINSRIHQSISIYWIQPINLSLSHTDNAILRLLMKMVMVRRRDSQATTRNNGPQL